MPGSGPPGGGQATAPEAARDVPLATTLSELPLEGPAQPTAVVETSYTIDGAVMPVVRGNTRQSTRADMRRNDSLLAFDNWLLRRVAGNGRHADIVRTDRRLLWTLKPANQTYTECPITGCAAGRTNEPQNPREPAQPREPECPTSVRLNELKVSSTGERKTLNGFSTERFQIAWTLAIEDSQSRRATNARDAKTLQAWGNELRKVRGYPISVLATWNAEGGVCDSGGAAGAGGGMPSLSGILGGLTGQKPTPSSGGGGALVSYAYEVKAISVRPVADSAFVPPPSYQKQ